MRIFLFVYERNVVGSTNKIKGTHWQLMLFGGRTKSRIDWGNI